MNKSQYLLKNLSLDSKDGELYENEKKIRRFSSKK